MTTCCFIGHRNIPNSDELFFATKNTIQSLINAGITTFLFGSKSKFNDLCLNIVTEFKKTYPYLTRVFVRAEYEYINQDYENYLLQQYERTYYSKLAHNSGKLAYIKRNKEIIDKSDICVFYYEENYKLPSNKSSGTKIAFDYAKTKNKIIFNMAR